MSRIGANDRRRITVELNGEARSGFAEPRHLLSDFLRHELGATGTHVGCEHGVCGACTVLLDGQPVRSCLTLAVQVDGARVRTVEGIGQGEELGPLQRAFKRHFALQCGFCTPGILITLSALLRECPDADEATIRTALGGHICRCTGYTPIVQAALAAAAEMRGDGDV